jgi:hypothetical protein
MHKKVNIENLEKFINYCMYMRGNYCKLEISSQYVTMPTLQKKSLNLCMIFVVFKKI